MAATRLLRTSGPLGLHLPSSSSSSYCSLKNPTLSSTITNRSREGENREKRLGGGGVGEKKPLAAVKAVAATTERVIISEPQTNIGGVGLASDLVIKIANMALLMLKMATKRRPWSLHAQMFIERTIVDCRFFALFAVAGSLLGSVLCFLEGCFLVIESYLQYFHAMSHRSDQGYVVQLLIEAIDMFMVGTAMLVFGMGLHVMFVGSKHGNSSHLPTPSSNLFGLFNLNANTSKMGMHGVSDTSKVENWACCDYDSASGSGGEIQEHTFGYCFGSCLFWRRFISFIGMYIPPLTAICWWHYTR
ncbi:unnamed protein product [Camellia sinensis]